MALCSAGRRTPPLVVSLVAHVLARLRGQLRKVDARELPTHMSRPIVEAACRRPPAYTRGQVSRSAAPDALRRARGYGGPGQLGINDGLWPSQKSARR